MSGSVTKDFALTLPNVSPEVDLDVVGFVGREGISELFAFEVDVTSEEAALAFADLIGQAATFEIRPPANEVDVPVRTVHGIVAEVQQGGSYALQSAGQVTGERNAYFYRFLVVPRLWRASLTRRSRVFRDLALPALVEAVLTGAGLTSGTDFTLDGLTAAYPQQEYRAQYDESDLAFLSRVLEEAGAHFFFTHEDDRDVLVVADGNPVAADGEARYLGKVAFPGSADSATLPALRHVAAHQRMVPGAAEVLDVDFAHFPKDTAPTDGAVRAATPGGGSSGVEVGTAGAEALVQEAIEAVKTAQTAGAESIKKSEVAEAAKQDRKDALAARLAHHQERLAGHAFFLRGEGATPGFAPGFAFNLTGLFHRTDLEGEGYLLTRVHHVGAQQTAMPPGLDRGLTSMRHDDPGVARLWTLFLDEGDARFGGRTEVGSAHDRYANLETNYLNAFAATLNAVPFRPERRTPVPRAHGIVTGTIEKHADDRLLDAEGRYRIRMPFDKGTDPNASRPIRMAQPYTGTDYGLHFPNPDGAEAVVAFIDGDPDRPVALSTVPNAFYHSPVPNTQKALKHDEKQNVVRTHLGHTLILDDKDGKENVAVTLKTAVHTDNDRLDKADDRFYSSSIEMGGTYVQTDQDLLNIARASLTTSYVQTLVGRSIPAAVGAATALAAYQGQTVANAWAGKSAVGVKVRTTKTVDLAGWAGVTISAPNVLGNAALLADDKASKTNYVIAGLMDLALTTILKGIISATLEEVDKFKKAQKEDDAPTWYQALFKYKEGQLGQKVVTTLFDAAVAGIGAGGVNVKSAGSINLLSFLSVQSGSMFGSVSMTAFDKVEAKAGTSIDMSSNEGITIKTTGKQAAINDREPFKTVNSICSIADKAGALDKLKSAWAKMTGFPDPFPILIQNETGHIQLRADEGVIEQQAKGEQGAIASLANKGPVLLGAGIAKDKSVSNACLLDPEQGVALYAKDKPIVLQTGDSALILQPDGNIILQGKKVTVLGEDAATVTGKNVTVAGASAGGGVTVGVGSPLQPIAAPTPAPPAQAAKSTVGEIIEAVGKATHLKAPPPAPYPSGSIQNKVELKQAGVTATSPTGTVKLDGMNLELEAKVKAALKAVNIDLSASALAKLKAALTQVG